MALDIAHREFAAHFALAILAQDFTTAHQLLAPWLQQVITPESLAEKIQQEVNTTLEANELEGDFHPSSYEIDSNSCSLTDLKAPRSYAENRDIPAEVTGQNFRQWMVIQFQPSEEEDLAIDAYFDWWMIVIEENDQYKIGYFEIEDPD